VFVPASVPSNVASVVGDSSLGTNTTRTVSSSETAISQFRVVGPMVAVAPGVTSSSARTDVDPSSCQRTLTPAAFCTSRESAGIGTPSTYLIVIDWDS
jgi:hypothetical protein